MKLTRRIFSLLLVIAILFTTPVTSDLSITNININQPVLQMVDGDDLPIAW